MSIYYPTITEQVKALPLFLSAAGLFFEETNISRQHGYSDYQWILTVSGHGEISIGDETFHVDSNVGIFIPAHIPHSYKKISSN